MMNSRYRRMVCIAGVAVAAAGLWAGASWAQEGTDMYNQCGGTVVLLDDAPWLLATDPGNVGRDQAWWQAPAADAKPTAVPGIIQETFPLYHGVVWYWCDFTAPANPYPQGRSLLRFWAVSYYAEVWLNGAPVGRHEGGETPFVLDVTGAIRPGEVNRLAVRVLNPTDTPIDGMTLNEIPHRNNTMVLRVGAGFNIGGIMESVELLDVPAVRVDDVYVRPDWQTGTVHVQATLLNATDGPIPAGLVFQVSPASSDQVVAAAQVGQELPPGVTQFEHALDVPNHHLWDLDDPCLYRVTVRLSSPAGAHEQSVRFGFRDFRVEKGFFRLNGKRLFLKSSHTGNHCPVGQMIPPREAPDLLRKDLLYLKSSGFNTVRFIAGLPHPWQLDMCDELGLMVYEETFAGWCLADSPEMGRRYDASIREMALRDRNHPSVAIFGLLNEVGDGPVFRQAVAVLPQLRELDDTRLVLLGSGRWDGQFGIGSACNPGSAAWEYVWGVEGPNEGSHGGPQWGGYVPGAGDAHVYPGTPHPPEIETTIRTLGKDTKPVFLSEYGIGSLMNAVRELRTYEQYGINPELEDMKFFQATVDLLTADWRRFGVDQVYASPETMLADSQLLHCRQRLFGFNLIRSNPQICGYNLTGLLDHGFTGEGLWTFWREWKPGIVDALRNGWAPLRWCLFAHPMHGYVGRPIRLEAVLATEDVLPPGDYPVTLRVMGPSGCAWEQTATAQIPQPAPGEDGPLAVPVFDGDVVLDGPPGSYEFAAILERGGAPAGGQLTFFVSDVPALPEPQAAVTAWGISEGVQQWLGQKGVACMPFDAPASDAREVILVGDLSQVQADLAARTELMRRVARGGLAVFLSPKALVRDDNPVGWLPLENKGHGNEFPDWLYHKECVAGASAVFDGLAGKRIMDWDYYGPVISHYFFEGADTPDDTMAAAFAICHSAPPGGYAAGVMIGAYKFGAGAFVINTFNVLDNIDQHPAADRLLLNLIRYAGAAATGPLVELPQDFNAQLERIGYK